MQTSKPPITSENGDLPPLNDSDRIVVRNVSACVIRVESPAWWQGDSVRIWNHKDQLQAISTIVYAGAQQHWKIALEAGSDVVLQAGGITILSPGNYISMFTLDLPDVLRRDREGIEQARLSTEMVDFVFVKNKQPNSMIANSQVAEKRCNSS